FKRSQALFLAFIRAAQASPWSPSVKPTPRRPPRGTATTESIASLPCDLHPGELTGRCLGPPKKGRLRCKDATQGRAGRRQCSFSKTTRSKGNTSHPVEVTA